MYEGSSSLSCAFGWAQPFLFVSCWDSTDKSSEAWVYVRKDLLTWSLDVFCFVLRGRNNQQLEVGGRKSSFSMKKTFLRIKVFYLWAGLSWEKVNGLQCHIQV